MANFSPSNLLNGQAIFNEQMQSAEFRAPDIAAFGVASKAEVANPSLKLLRTREDRAVKAYMPIRQAAIGGSARAYNHTGARGDSSETAISWTTFSEPFSISMKQAGNNNLAWQQMYAASKRNAILNLLDRIDAWFVAQLVAAKTQVNAGGGNGVFNATSYDLEIAAAYRDYFFQNAKASVEYNLFRGDIIGIVDDKANVLAQKLSAQGSANATNFGFQFNGLSVVPSTRTVLSGFDGSGLFFKNGLVAVVPWIPVENRKAIDPRASMSVLGDFGSFTVPEIGVTFASHIYAERADASGSNGSAQDVVIQEEISLDIGVVVAPLSTSNASPIFSVAQLV